MRAPATLAALALLLSVVALVTSLARSSSSRTRNAEVARLPSLVTDAELSARVDALAQENRELRARLEQLELRPLTEARAPLAAQGAPSPRELEQELEALRERVRTALDVQALASGAEPTSFPSPEFIERVARSLTELEIQAAVEDARQSVDWRSSRLTEALPAVARELALTPPQHDALESALVALYDTQANYGVLYASGEVPREEFGELKEADMQAFRSELEGILTQEQLERYGGLVRDKESAWILPPVADKSRAD